MGSEMCIRDSPHVDDDVKAFLRHATRRHGAAACWENFLSPRDIALLLPEVHCLTRLPGGGCTFFIAEDEQPACALERYAFAIAEYHVRNSLEPPQQKQQQQQCIGAEWWVHVIAPDDPLSIHWDCDESRKSSTGEHIPPFVATVTYLTSVGAPTVALPVIADAAGHAQPASSATGGALPPSAFASFPLAGKHFVFDGRLLHGAPYDLSLIHI